MKKWSAFAFLFASCIMIPTAQAGLLGDLVGAAVAHHEEQQQKQDSRKTFLAEHPVIGLATGTVAANAADGVVAGAAERFVMNHKVAAIGGTAIALGVGDMSMRRDLYAGHCVKNGFEWSCPGIPGQHVIVVEWKDYLYFESAGKLKRNMEKDGDPSPGKDCVPHHIVPRNAKRMVESRDILQKCGIGLNDAINGVWLPQSMDSACGKSTYHPTLHTNKYYDKITTILKLSFFSDRCDGVRNALKKIKSSLSSNQWG